MSRFYLASAFRHRGEVQRVCDIVEAQGHIVPVKWWDHSADAHELKAQGGSDEEFYARSSVQMTFCRDFGGVALCDVFVFIASDEPSPYNGANVELGFALALGKPCYVLGRLQRSAMYAPVRFRQTIQQVLEEELE